MPRNNGGNDGRIGMSTSVYRDVEEAAKSRVEALEHELSNARHELAALSRRSMMPVELRLLEGLRLILAAKVLDLLLQVLLPMVALHVGLWVISLAYLSVNVVTILGLLRLQAVSSTIKREWLVLIALLGECLYVLLNLGGLLQYLTGDLGNTLWLGWRIASLLATVPLLLLYHKLGRRFERRSLSILGVVSLGCVLAQQLSNIAIKADHLDPFHIQLYVWSGLVVSILILMTAALAFVAVRKAASHTMQSPPDRG